MGCNKMSQKGSCTSPMVTCSMIFGAIALPEDHLALVKAELVNLDLCVRVCVRMCVRVCVCFAFYICLGPQMGHQWLRSQEPGTDGISSGCHSPTACYL